MLYLRRTNALQLKVIIVDSCQIEDNLNENIFRILSTVPKFVVHNIEFIVPLMLGVRRSNR